MRIGTNIPAYQRMFLRQAEEGKFSSHHLASLIDDSDIRSGTEELHPQWLKYFEENRDKIRVEVSPRTFQKICETLDPLIGPDNGLFDIDPRSMRLSFLLGAGASKPKPSSIPTVQELLPQLLERARRLDRDDVSRLADFCEQRGIVNIEDLLTAAQLATFASRNPVTPSVMNHLLYGETPDRRPADPLTTGANLASVAFLQDTLQVLFGLLSSTMLPATPNAAHISIAKYAVDRNVSVVTTNYDCCMDLAFSDTIPFQYGIPFENASEATRESQCPLIKLHGSLNWFYCDTCQTVHLVNQAAMFDHFASNAIPFPVIGICKTCGGQRRCLLVPPLAMKFDVAHPLTGLFDRAQQAFEAAQVIVVVGFSFADADMHISRMLSKSMQKETSQVVVVVDPERSVGERLRRKFKASIPAFNEKRIVLLPGDCSTQLPAFLEGRLEKRNEVVDAGVDQASAGARAVRGRVSRIDRRPASN